MSGPEKPTPEKSVQDFLLRWSRRKLGIVDPDDTMAAPAAQPQAGDTEAAPPAEAPPQATTAFDPKSLPPIESIDAASDIRAFLAPGVPVELTRAALRRAWASDPAIRDFVGIAENQWDFTNPDAVPGFGSLEFGEQVRGMVARLFGETPAPALQNPTGSSGSAIPERAEQVAARQVADPDAAALPGSGAGSLAASPPDAENHAAPQNESDAEEGGLVPRKHGGALPK
jgi:hypothetical protein